MYCVRDCVCVSTEVEVEVVWCESKKLCHGARKKISQLDMVIKGVGKMEQSTMVRVWVLTFT